MKKDFSSDHLTLYIFNLLFNFIIIVLFWDTEILFFRKFNSLMECKFSYVLSESSRTIATSLCPKTYISLTLYNLDQSFILCLKAFKLKAEAMPLGNFVQRVIFLITKTSYIEKETEISYNIRLSPLIFIAALRMRLSLHF